MSKGTTCRLIGWVVVSIIVRPYLKGTPRGKKNKCENDPGEKKSTVKDLNMCTHVFDLTATAPALLNGPLKYKEKWLRDAECRRRDVRGEGLMHQWRRGGITWRTEKRVMNRQHKQALSALFASYCFPPLSTCLVSFSTNNVNCLPSPIIQFTSIKFVPGFSILHYWPDAVLSSSLPSLTRR